MFKDTIQEIMDELVFMEYELTRLSTTGIKQFTLERKKTNLLKIKELMAEYDSPKGLKKLKDVPMSGAFVKSTAREDYTERDVFIVTDKTGTEIKCNDNTGHTHLFTPDWEVIHLY
jgi:hypothetical protein